jgi:hypothetical protein
VTQGKISERLWRFHVITGRPVVSMEDRQDLEISHAVCVNGGGGGGGNSSSSSSICSSNFYGLEIYAIESRL